MSAVVLRVPLTLLYFLAGLPLGVFAEVVPVFLRAGGMSLEGIGWYSAINLPYSFKVFLAPLVDRIGRLRTWLLCLGAVLALAYVGLAAEAAAPRAHIIAVALLLMTGASATFDIALDATFVRTLAGQGPAAHGSANAWRLSAFKAAMVSVGSAGVVIAGLVGFRPTFIGIAVVHVIVLSCVAWRHMPNEVPPSRSGVWLREFWAWCVQPNVLHAFALSFLYKLSIATFLWMEKPFWVDRGVSLQRIGTNTALVGLLGTLMGANLGSRLAHRFGLVTLLDAGLVLQSGLGLAYVLIGRLPPSSWTLAVGLSLSGITFGLSTAALMNIITRMCKAGHAATQFAALTGCYGLARSVGGILSGACAGRYGYLTLFALVAVLTVPALCLLPRRAYARRAWESA